MKNIYNISFPRIALLLLPSIIRKKTLIAFLAAMMRPLEDLNEDFTEYRDSIDTQVNCQICRMRGMLNDRFDYYRRRITVRTTPMNKDIYLLWKDQCGKPNIICNERYPDMYQPSLLSSDGQLGCDNSDFEIIFPAGYRLSKNETNHLTALVNNHKLASKNFSITYG